jgi:hypothetical protein
MITNIIASIVVTVVTNVYAPKQYLDDSIRCPLSAVRRTIANGWIARQGVI